MTPALTAPAPARVADMNDPVHKAGFFLLCVYFFISYSRILDILAPRLHIPMMVTLLLYALTALGGGIQKALKTLPSKLFLAITVLIILGIPFGVWPGGAFQNLMNQWLKAAPLYFIVVGLIATTDECKRLIRWIAWAIFVMAIIALARGEQVLGRLIIDNSRFGDPNDLAMICILGISMWFATASAANRMIGKIVAAIAVAILMYAIVRTGSRGAFLGLLGMVLFVFLRANMMGKLKMAGAGLVLVPVLVMMLPRDTLLRWTLVFDDSIAEQHEELGSAAASADARWSLFVDSLILTLKYPVFGVGLGNFAVAENEYAQDQGLRRGSWHATHNMYTQVSSECGILAAALYVGIMVYVYRRLSFLQKKLGAGKQQWKPLKNTALWVQMGFVGFCVSGFFLSVAYVDVLPLMAGIVVALETAVHRDFCLSATMTPPLGRPQ